MTAWGGSAPLTAADLRQAARLMSGPYRADPPPALTAPAAAEYLAARDDAHKAEPRPGPADTPRHPSGCPHCGRNSHGFICCGQAFADEPGGCPNDHGPEPGRTRAPAKGQSGPPKPLRPPRRIDPRRTR